MANNRTSIEVSATGEFSQLTRGLREVKGALSDVTGVIDRGAKSGGMFNDKDVRALDIFTRRFGDSMNRMNRLMDDQARKLEQLYSRRRQASSTDIAAIDKEIQKHGEYLDRLEREREELEELMRLRQQESQAFGRPSAPPPTTPPGTPPPPIGGPSYSPSSTGGDSLPGGGMGLAGGALGTLGRGLKGIVGLAASIAGLSFGIGQLMKWEQMAEQREIQWQPLIQRTGINRSAAEGVGLQYGYNTMQTRQALDVYTQEAGRAGMSDVTNMAAFSRGYGVDLNTTAAMSGQYAQLGYGTPGTVLGNLAGSAENSGMTPRILEVMESQLGFLRSMDHSLKDNSGNNLLAYTTRINQIGNEDGAQKLTGINGASLLEKMGSNIFNPGNTRWQAMGMTLLSKYGGNNVKNMDSFGRMEQWQKGFQDPENMRVLGKYLADATKNMNPTQATEYKTLTLQEAMGGGTTLQQAQQFGELTNWLQKFSPDDPKMKGLLAGGNAPGNTKGVGAASQVTAQMQKWSASLDSKIEVTNAGWIQAQTEAGKLLIPAKLQLEGMATNALNGVTQAGNNATGGQGLNWEQLLGVGAGLMLAPKLLKGGAKGIGRLFGRGGPRGGGGAGTGGSALGAVEEGAEDLAEHSESGLWRLIQKGGGKALAGLGKVPGVGNVLRAGVLAHTIANTTSPLYQKTIGKVLSGTGQAVTGVTRSLANVTSAAATPHNWGSALKFGGKVLGKVPIIGGVVDTLINHQMGDSWGRSIAGGVGGMAGTLLGSTLGPLGAIGGGIAGNYAGGKIYDWFNPSQKQTTEKQTNLIKELSDKGTLKLSDMSKEGQDSIRHLEQDGLVHLGKMNKDGTQEIKALSDTGAKSLLDLQDKGTIHLSAVDATAKDLSTKLQEQSKSGWQTFTDTVGGYFKDFFGKQNPTSTTSNSDGKMTPLQYQGWNNPQLQNYSINKYSKSVTADKINQMLKGSDLAGHGQDFIQAGVKSGIDPAFLVSMTYAEQGFRNPYGSNNFVGLTKDMGMGDGRRFKANDGQNLAGFATVQDGLLAAAKNLQNYVKGGTTSISDVAKKWVGNDNYVEEAQNIVYMLNKLNGYNGMNPSNADGAVIARDQISMVHGGEEIISRPKTGEVRRKTGLLPSQLLNRAMQDSPSGPTASGGGATSKTEHVFTVKLESSQDLSHIPAGDLIALVKQVIQEEKFKLEVRNAFF